MQGVLPGKAVDGSGIEEFPRQRRRNRGRAIENGGPFSFYGVRGQPGLKLREGFRHVAATVTETDVARFVINVSGKEQDTGFSDESLAKGLDIVTRNKAGKAYGAGVGWSPREEITVAREERRELAQVAENDLEVAIDEFLAMAEGKSGEEFTGSAGADGGVVLEGDDFLEDCGVTAGQPAEAQAGKSVGFADGAEAERAVVEVASGRKTRGGIVLEFAVDLVGEHVEVMASGEIQNGAENLRWHEQSGRVVGRVDVDGAGVRADEGFERGEIVRPGVAGAAAPFADSGASAFGEGERTFVTGRFDDDVIVGREQRMIEEEDGLLRGGSHDKLVRTNLIVNGGEDFAEPGSAGGFRVTAPVFQESIVRARFEGEKLLNGL